jgi:hypothetical protein
MLQDVDVQITFKTMLEDEVQSAGYHMFTEKLCW